MIFGLLGFPAMGIVGAALATVLARFLSVIAALSIINFRLKLLDLSRPKFAQTIKSWGHILHIGLPASATSVLTPVSMGIVTHFIAEYGDPAVAAVGAGGRVEFLAMMLVMSLGSVLLPFTGQNLGAKEFSRIRQARQISHRFAMVWGLLMFLVVGALAGPISHVFSKDPTVLGHMKSFLRIIPLSYGFNGIIALSCLMLNGLHRPIQSAMLTLIRTVILLVPLSWIGGKLWGVNGIFIGMAMANVISGILAKIALAADFKKILHAESGSPAPSGM
jgi:Na+-driven multidrug efflux pump